MVEVGRTCGSGEVGSSDLGVGAGVGAETSSGVWAGEAGAPPAAELAGGWGEFKPKYHAAATNRQHKAKRPINPAFKRFKLS